MLCNEEKCQLPSAKTLLAVVGEKLVKLINEDFIIQKEDRDYCEYKVVIVYIRK